MSSEFCEIKEKIKTRHKEVLLQSTGGQWLESSPGGSGQCRVCQRLQERLRPQLQERYRRHKPVSLPVHQPTSTSTSKYKYISLSNGVNVTLQPNIQPQSDPPFSTKADFDVFPLVMPQQ